MLGVVQSIAQMGMGRGYTPAIINGPRIITYEELLQLIARVSNHLADRGVKPGARLFLNILDPDMRFVAALASLHSGSVPYILTELGDLRSGRDVDYVVGGPKPFIAGLPSDVMIDESVLNGRLADPKLRDFADRADGDVLFIAGTSGTTGLRKLVVDRAGGNRRRWSLPNRSREIPAGSRFLLSAGDASKRGFSSTLRVLRAKATVVRLDPDLERTLRYINLYSVTHFLATPADLESLLDAMERTGTRAPSLKTIDLGGSLFAKSLVERAARLLDAPVFTVTYGASETGMLTRGEFSAETFRPGYVGELSVGTRVVAAGTREAPAPIVLANEHGWFTEYYADGKIVARDLQTYTMPDLGYLEGNSLYLVGRSDEVFNLGGEKFAFSIVEDALREQPGVREVALANLPLGSEKNGVIVAISGEALDLERLTATACASVGAKPLRGFFRFVVLPAIPRSAAGKVDRNGVLASFRELGAPVS